MLRTALSTAVTLVLLAGCGDGGTPAPTVRDVRVAIPAPDPAYVDIVGPQDTWPPGSDKMMCANTTYTGSDTAFTSFDGEQGKFGHHIVLLAPIGTSADHPDGEIYDCTEMKDFQPIAFPIDNGMLQPGFGTFLKGGQRLVVQSHYVNTGSQSLLVRDLVRLKTTPVASVTTWTSIFVNNQSNFTVPPHGPATVTFECPVQEDMDLLVLGGHMHEWGTSYKVEIGPTEASMTQAYAVDQWKTEFRDSPPTNLYFGSPMHLAQGTIVRTTCSWMNTEDAALTFPKEMCATFGYVAGPKDPIVCNAAP